VELDLWIPEHQIGIEYQGMDESRLQLLISLLIFIQFNVFEFIVADSNC
jgi:hypothetical protein